jgi:hypothetical protein
MECGLCDGMRICTCRPDTRRRERIATAVMQAAITGATQIKDGGVCFLMPDAAVDMALKYADALIAELDK